MTMHRSSRHLALVGSGVLLAASLPLAAASAVPSKAAPGSAWKVVAKNLDNPRHLSFGPNGALYVAEAGHGSKGTGPYASDPEGGGRIYLGLTGGVTRVRSGVQTRVVSHLPSGAGVDGSSAGGLADVAVVNGRLALLLQDSNLTATGGNPFGAPGRLLGHLLTRNLRGGALKEVANFGTYEAKHNPDKGGGARPGEAIDSDPFAMTPYRGGWAVADAAGNDLLWVSPRGAISVLAVFPFRMVPVPAGVAGPAATTLPVQAVPTSVVVGPDGALYVGELTGFPFIKGLARVWRVVPGAAPKVYATGFTNITDLAFDKLGRLLVLEMSTRGLLDEKAPGAVVRLAKNGSRTTLASAGLVAPTGLAIGPGSKIYVSNYGVMPAAGAGPHGQVVSF